MQSNFKAPFKRYVKKAHLPLQLAIEDEVQQVCERPLAGELKKGDLAGIRVHKFVFNRQEYLMAYRPIGLAGELEFIAIDFYQIGAHENFYTDLKRFLKGK
jgi:hypothetical protein